MGDRMQGKVVLVTGAASGIGRGCAERLAAEGAAVVATDVDAALGEETVARIRAGGGKAQFLVHDVTDEGAWENTVQETLNACGGLDVLVNNAGIAMAVTLLDMSLEDWRRQQAVNLDGVFLGIKHCVPAMRERGGAIVNISSVAGIKGSPRLAGYCATKGGVRLLTKAAAREFAAEGINVRVNSVHPGVIATPIWHKVTPDAIQMPGSNQVDMAEVAQLQVPTGVLGQPLDIANGVLFLASDESSYINGTELVIDAGLSA